MAQPDKSEFLTPPPSLMKALTAGFDAISNHAWLVAFTLILDLLLWVGPRFRIYSLLQDLLAQQSALTSASNTGMIESLQEMVRSFNLLSSLRTFPIGIPSLMATRAPELSPFGTPVIFEIHSLGQVLLIWLLLNIIGMAVGALYFSLVSQVAVNGKVSWQKLVQGLPQTIYQVFLLALVFLMMFFLLGLPFSCLISMTIMSGIGLEQISVFIALIAGGLLIWLLVPLVFSPHGIFVYQHKVLQAVKSSIRISKMTMPTTSIFILVIVVINEGMSLLWSIPEENSWLSLIGILGHAFVTTGLLASSFVYFKDADKWVKDLIERTRLTVV